MIIIPYLKNLKGRVAGFTMIELLIVIAILGILAVAVLAAINPVEQINRSRDTATRSDAEQLIGAIDRFNAMKGYYPWVTNPQDDFDVDPMVQLEPSTTWSATGLADCAVLKRLSDGDQDCEGTDELKAAYVQKILASDANYLSVYNRGEQGDSTYVCFTPKSKSFKDQAIDRCNETLPADYPGGICDTSGDGSVDSADNPMICLP